MINESMLDKLEALREVAIANGNQEVILDKCIRIAERYWQAYVPQVDARDISAVDKVAIALEKVIDNSATGEPWSYENLAKAAIAAHRFDTSEYIILNDGVRRTTAPVPSLMATAKRDIAVSGGPYDATMFKPMLADESESAQCPSVATKAELIKLVRDAIYNTWHNDGFANVDGVAAIAVGAIGSYLKLKSNADNAQPSVEAAEGARFMSNQLLRGMIATPSNDNPQKGKEMRNLRDDIWHCWHKKENRQKVLLRLEQITRLEKKRLSAAARLCNFKNTESHEQDRKMLQHWANEIDNCSYESLGIANGLLGKKMP